MKVWQIYYDDHSRSKLDSRFIPYSNVAKLDEFFENSVILDIWKNKRSEWRNEDYVGVLSWRMREKTNLLFEDIQDKVGGTEVCIVAESRYYNARGTLNIEVVKHIAQLADQDKLFPFDLCDFDLKYDNKECVCYNNFFLVSPKVFDDYCRNYLSVAVEWLKSKNIKQKCVHRGESYPVQPFFLEGLFQCYVHYNKIPFKYIFDDVRKRNANKIFEDKDITELLLN